MGSTIYILDTQRVLYNVSQGIFYDKTEIPKGMWKGKWSPKLYTWWGVLRWGDMILVNQYRLWRKSTRPDTIYLWQWEKEMVLFLKSLTQNVSRHDTGQPVSSLKKIDPIWYNRLVRMRKGNGSFSKFMNPKRKSTWYWSTSIVFEENRHDLV